MDPVRGDHDYPAWLCPACGEKVEGIGPTTMALAIATHIHERHERAILQAKALPPAPGAAVTGRDWRQAVQGALGLGGADGLTPFDRTFLKTLRASWDAPAGWPRCVDYPDRT